MTCCAYPIEARVYSNLLQLRQLSIISILHFCNGSLVYLEDIIAVVEVRKRFVVMHMLRP